VSEAQDNAWEPRLGDLTWQEFALLPDEHRLVVIVAGAIEQHGYHLPLRTDSLNAEAVALEAAVAERVLVAPTIDYGVSANHMAFPGTISLRQSTLVALLVDVVDSLYRHGIRRFVLFNGNGGNADAMRYAAGDIRGAFDGVSVGFSDLGDFRPDVALASGVIYHADETETSHTLHVAPGSVRTGKLRREMTDAFEEHYRRYYEADGDLHGLISYGLPPTAHMSASGVMGDATVASAAMGATWHGQLVAMLRRAIADAKARPLLVGGLNGIQHP
jgi:creatinine amidohydrolase